MSETIYEIPPDWKQRAYVKEPDYHAIYERSIADPNGFVYRAELGAAKWSIGSEVPFSEGLRLRAEAPLNGRFRLVRDGVVVLEQQGSALEYNVDRPGVYRVEVWLNLAGEDRPWILTNPIYVREKKKS